MFTIEWQMLMGVGLVVILLAAIVVGTRRQYSRDANASSKARVPNRPWPYMKSPLTDAVRLGRRNARRAMKRYRAIWTVYREYEPIEFTSSTYPDLDLPYYDRTRDLLVTKGFIFLGDLKQPLPSNDPRFDTVTLAPPIVRALLSSEGTTMASIYQTIVYRNPTSPRPLKRIASKVLGMEFETELSDGTFVTTLNSTSEHSSCPGWILQKFAPLTPVEELLAHHLRAVNDLRAQRPGVSPVAHAGLQDCLESARRKWKALAAFKRSDGYVNPAQIQRWREEMTSIGGQAFCDELERLRRLAVAEAQSPIVRQDRSDPSGAE